MPGLGANLTDVLFPHMVYGFRGINVPLATYHVCKDLFFSPCDRERPDVDFLLLESAVADHLVEQLWRKGIRRAGFRCREISREKIEFYLYHTQPDEQSDHQTHSKRDRSRGKATYNKV